MEIVHLGPERCDALLRFFAELPEGDLTFIKEEVTDRLTIGGDPVHLDDIRVPFLAVRATRDHIVPPDAAAPLIDLVGSPDKHELCLDAGHMGLVVGRTAAKTTVPTIIDFVRRRSDPVAGDEARREA